MAKRTMTVSAATLTEYQAMRTALVARRDQLLKEAAEIDKALGEASKPSGGVSGGGRTGRPPKSSGKAAGGKRAKGEKKEPKAGTAGGLILELLRSGKGPLKNPDIQAYLDKKKGKKVSGLGVALGGLKKQGYIQSVGHGQYAIVKGG